MIDWIRKKIQSWHNDRCKRIHLREAHQDWKSFTEVPVELKNSAVFARMTRVEQEAILYTKLAEEVRDGREPRIFNNYGEMRDELYKLKNKKWNEAVESISARANCEVKTGRLPDGMTDRVVVTDPKTEVTWTYTRHPDEDVDHIIEDFPRRVLESAVDDNQWIHDNLQEAKDQ